MIRRFGQIGKLKPDKIDEYVRLHAKVWPDVLKMIQLCNLRNYSIFRYGEYVFSYYEYIGDNYEADMDKMAADSTTQRWWLLTHPCFENENIPWHGEFFHDMDQIFYHDGGKEV